MSHFYTFGAPLGYYLFSHNFSTEMFKTIFVSFASISVAAAVNRPPRYTVCFESVIITAIIYDTTAKKVKNS